jgi:hypothetical protein
VKNEEHLREIPQKNQKYPAFSRSNRISPEFLPRKLPEREYRRAIAQKKPQMIRT